MTFIVGNNYIVPVVTVKKSNEEFVRYIVIDNVHGDKPNGQPYRHYHVDTRFKQEGHELRIDENRIILKQYEERECIGRYSCFGTGIDLLVNSKIRRCITPNGKCPHKGFDLTTIEPNEMGELHCPLHNLKFNAQTGQMIEAHQRFFDRKIMMDNIFPDFSLEDRNLGVKLGYEFPYIDPRIKNYEEKKLELLELKRVREKKYENDQISKT